ncbi:MAG TPA: M28 family peptidase [Candidatus Cybelea sp.]|jgi:N-acetylated-alpha-linked acidic dipeptidase|nr:M28 family peptidase [Candidatus Cybelea sp.]
MRRTNRQALAIPCTLACIAANASLGLAQTPPPIKVTTVTSDTALVGWAAGPTISAELEAEKTMMRVPSSANAMGIEHHLSSVPHRAGSAADYKTALYVQERLKADGFTTRIKEYQVMFTGPLEESLTMLSPRQQSFSMIEGVPGQPTKWERMAGPPFLEESGDGTVTGPVVYVNAASKDDLAELDAQHVRLNGAVALVRLGAPSAGGISSLDPSWIAYNELRKRGVAAILEFMEPATSGYGGGQMWPAGNYKNTNMAERMSGMSPRGFLVNPPGDPTLPGKAPLPGVPHESWNDIPHSTIPELSITQSTARTLLASLTGKVVPQTWHPMYEFVQHFGGNEIVRVHTKFERKVKTIWLVFGDMRGSEHPDSIVMIGSHRDAMTYGAIDPGSGTTVLLQDADAFHALAQQGWRPKRTIEFASWDGHELGLFGSASYIYEYGPQLRKSVFQYINTDQLTTGNPFVVSASPGLYAFMQQICNVVPAADGSGMLGQRDQRVRPLLNPISGGSDHQNFAYMIGVLSTTNGYYGAFGAHHTAEDNLDGLRTYDPGMREAVVTAQVTGIQAMRAANATVQPLRVEEIPEQMLRDLMPLQLAAFSRTDGKVTLDDVRAALDAYRTAAHATDVEMQKAEAAGDVAAMQAIAAREQASRDAFYVPDGLLVNPYYHTLDRVFTSLPEIAYTASKPDQYKQGVTRALNAIAQATAALVAPST